MDSELWRVYRRFAQLAVCLTAFGVGSVFLAFSLDLMAIGAFNSSTFIGAIGGVLMAVGLAGAVLIASSFRADPAHGALS